MNIKRFALGGFIQAKDDELLVRAITVAQAMDNNAYFPDPRPALADVLPLIQDFEEKLGIARRKGSPQDTAAKNVARLALADALKQLAFYVSRIADGELQILLSSGFELSSYPKAGDVPDVVRGILLRDGKQSGQLRLDFEHQNGVLLYEYRYGTEQEGTADHAWSEPFKTTSSRNNILAPLDLYQRYYVQVRAMNGFGTAPWCEPQSHVVR